MYVWYVCMCVCVYSMHLEGVLSLLSELEDAEAESSEADAVLQRLVRRNYAKLLLNQAIVPTQLNETQNEE